MDDQIVEVWASNLEQEMQNITRIFPKYPFVVFDTEFPGHVVPVPPNIDVEKQPYDYVKQNIDGSRLIQLGMTFMNAQGEMPTPSTWQFNFRFNLEEDHYAQDSIDLLTTSGINFDDMTRQGIVPEIFGYYFVSSGLPFNEGLIWVAFHSAYDFAYLAKSITGAPLPSTFAEFKSMLRIQFPHIVDVKHIKTKRGWKGGLERLASELGAKRHGAMHQAGSDALLTAKVFASLMSSADWGDDRFFEFDGGVYGFEAEMSWAHDRKTS